jgi:hypothetical protein
MKFWTLNRIAAAIALATTALATTATAIGALYVICAIAGANSALAWSIGIWTARAALVALCALVVAFALMANGPSANATARKVE